MKNSIIRACVFVGPMMMSFGSLANELSYDHIDLMYISTEADGFDADADGFGLAGSVLLNDSVFLTGGYSDLESDRLFNTDARARVRGYRLGLGYRHALAPATDLNASASFLRTEARLSGTGMPSASENENGYTLSAGLRHLFTPQLEAGAMVEHSNIIEGTDTSLTVNGLVHVTDTFSVLGAYGLGSDASTWWAGIRYNF